MTSFADYYYMALFVLSFILTIIYAYRWHKHFNIYFTLVFTLIPLVILGYVLMTLSTTLEGAVISLKFIYIGGCFLIFFIMISIFSLCQIRISKLARTLTLIAISIVYCFILTIGFFPFFYRKVSFEYEGTQGVLVREYGPVHTVFYIMLSCCFIASFAAIIYAYLKKRQVSRKILTLLFIPELVTFIAYFFRRSIGQGIELIPAAYVFAQVMYLGIARDICLYDVTETVIDSLLEADQAGFVSVDFKENYLGSTRTARKVIPELLELTVDRPFSDNKWIRENFLNRLHMFQEDEQKKEFHFRREGGGRIYDVMIQYLYDDRKKRGYQFIITDDTQNQEYISLINCYNADLEAEVRKKTESLVAMHNQLILGMATMVESRDNSTGGHIRRTSEGVRILVGEMRMAGAPGLTEEFCEDLIKAAPMHDLGKIAVDDAVLRKPGRFTDEEFSKMKQHAAEGARIVHEILKDTQDEEFRVIAENVAHYHHERWDGSGYPDGLKGEEIPLEARIMAIADVYDALVSRRVYKEAMSFEKANEIIMDGMGKHFDPGLKPYYAAARPKLEACYSGLSDGM